MSNPTTITCAYSVTAFGSLSAASLGARLAAVPYDPTLPNRYGALLTNDVTTTVGQVSTRTFTLRISPGEGSASATATLEPGEVGAPIQSITVSPGNSGYAARPIVSFSPKATLRNAIAYPLMKVANLIIVKGGSGYTSDPVLTFGGGGLAPGGTKAQGRVHVSGGTIISTILDIAGGPYNAPPTAFLSGGGGSGAYLQPLLGVYDLRIVDYGNSWLTPPTINFTPLYYATVGGASADPIRFAAPLRSFMKDVLQNRMQTTVLAAEPVVS